MKAWRYGGYGAGGDPAAAIAALELAEAPVPKPGPGQVRVRVQYAAVNPIDFKLMGGGMHGICPVAFPCIPGFDFSGTIDAVGEGVQGLAAGDAVVADSGLVETCRDPPPPQGCCGAFAERIVVPAALVAAIGGGDAAALAGLPLAGLTSYQALFTGAGADFKGGPLGDLQAGQKLLVLGGSTATGAFAVQLARHAGARVAATASSKPAPGGGTKLEAVRALGADQVIDYTATDWAEELAGQEYDMIYDCVGDNADWRKAPRVLKKGGLFVSIANFTPTALDAEDARFANFLVASDGGDLRKLVALVEEGKLKVAVDSVVPMAEVPAALRRSMGGKCGGKIIIDVAGSA